MSVRQLFSLTENFKYLEQQGYGDLFVEFLGNDVALGKIRGEYVSKRTDDAGNTWFVFNDVKKKKKTIPLDEFLFYLDAIIHEISLHELQLADGDIKFFGVLPILIKQESLLRLIHAHIQDGEDIRQYFTVKAQKNWPGSVKTLAVKALKEYKRKKNSSLARICREYSTRYLIEGEAINYKSLYTTARQLKTGNRLSRDDA